MLMFMLDMQDLKIISLPLRSLGLVGVVSVLENRLFYFANCS